jgi:hypothetical protein
MFGPIGYSSKKITVQCSLLQKANQKIQRMRFGRATRRLFDGSPNLLCKSSPPNFSLSIFALNPTVINSKTVSTTPFFNSKGNLRQLHHWSRPYNF